MEKYRLVEERTSGTSDRKGSGLPLAEDESSKENFAADGSADNEDAVVHVTQHAKPRNCITTAMNMLSSGTTDRVTLKATGKAINKAVTIAEILKRKMPLHQLTALGSCEIVNVYEPLEEGLDEVVNRHYMSCVNIVLSMTDEGIDVNDIGYQPPLPPEEIQPGDFNVQQQQQVAQQQQLHHRVQQMRQVQMQQGMQMQR